MFVRDGVLFNTGDIVTPIVGVCNCFMFCCTIHYVHSSIAIILMGKRELVALLDLSSWCLVVVERLFLPVLWGCLRFVIVVFPGHTHYFQLLCLFYQHQDIAKLPGESQPHCCGLRGSPHTSGRY